MNGTQKVASVFVSGFPFGFPDITLQIVLIISFCMIVSLPTNFVCFQLLGVLFSFFTSILFILHYCNKLAGEIRVVPLNNTEL